MRSSNSESAPLNQPGEYSIHDDPDSALRDADENDESKDGSSEPKSDA